MGNGLESAPGTGHYADCIHIQPCSDIPVESGNRGFADIVETVRFPAVIADRIPVTVRYDGLHRICSKPAAGLDGINIDEELDLPAGPQFRSRTSFQDLLL